MDKFWKWFQGLISVGISAGAGGVAVVVVDPKTFNLHEGIGRLGSVCGVLAVTHMALYLQHSPLPGVTQVTAVSAENVTVNNRE